MAVSHLHCRQRILGVVALQAVVAVADVAKDERDPLLVALPARRAPRVRVAKVLEEQVAGGEACVTERAGGLVDARVGHVFPLGGKRTTGQRRNRSLKTEDHHRRSVFSHSRGPTHDLASYPQAGGHQRRDDLPPPGTRTGGAPVERRQVVWPCFEPPCQPGGSGRDRSRTPILS